MLMAIKALTASFSLVILAATATSASAQDYIPSHQACDNIARNYGACYTSLGIPNQGVRVSLAQPILQLAAGQVAALLRLKPAGIRSCDFVADGNITSEDAQAVLSFRGGACMRYNSQYDHQNFLSATPINQGRKQSF